MNPASIYNCSKVNVHSSENGDSSNSNVNNAIPAVSFTSGCVAGYNTAAHFGPLILPLSTGGTTTLTNLTASVGLALGTPLAFFATAFGTIVCIEVTKKLKNYATRYPKPKDEVEQALNDLLNLKNDNRMNDLKNYIKKNYHPSRYFFGTIGTTSSGSGTLYDLVIETENNETIYNLVDTYLSKKDGDKYYHVGKTMHNLILDWIKSQA